MKTSSLTASPMTLVLFSQLDSPVTVSSSVFCSEKYSAAWYAISNPRCHLNVSSWPASHTSIKRSPLPKRKQLHSGQALLFGSLYRYPKEKKGRRDPIKSMHEAERSTET